MKWLQDGRNIYFKYKGRDIYWTVPQDCKLKDIHPDALSLIKKLLFLPFHEDIVTKAKPKESRVPKEGVGLSFSGGVDSTAAMLLLPENTVASYMWRDFKSPLTHANLVKLVKAEKERKIWTVRSNHEKIRTFNGLPTGFSTDLACMTHLILMSDYHNVGHIATGTILGSAYLYQGVYRDFSTRWYWPFWSEMFRDHGFELVMPVAGLSEVLTTKIVAQTKYGSLASACVRATNGCKKCYKCYRKSLLLGKKIPMPKEAIIFLSKKPPKHPTSSLYALQKNGITPNVCREYLAGQDYSYLDYYHPTFIQDIIPEHMRSDIEQKLEQFKCRPMDHENFEKMKSCNLKKIKKKK